MDGRSLGTVNSVPPGFRYRGRPVLGRNASTRYPFPSVLVRVKFALMTRLARQGRGPRGMWTGKARSEHRIGQACHRRWAACGKPQGKARRRNSRRCQIWQARFPDQGRFNPNGNHSLLLPTPAEGIVKLDECQTLIELCLGEIQFRGEIICFAGQHLQVACAAILVKRIRDAIGVLRSGRQ